MKVCPRCAFTNDEGFAICAYCNASLADVPVTPSADPNAPEHEQRRQSAARHARTRRQLRFAAVVYVLAITVSAIVPGFIFTPWLLLLYAASAALVALSVTHEFAGRFAATVLQGAFTVVLVSVFGPGHIMTFFMFALHAMLPVLFCHWTELIHSAIH